MTTRTPEDRSAWVMLWMKACANMPSKPRHLYTRLHRPNGTIRLVKTSTQVNGYCGKYGQQSALAKCLGYTGHVAVYNGCTRGVIPLKEWQRRRLKMLAGPYGEVFARMYLKQPHPNYTRNEKERARKKRLKEQS